MRPLWSSEASGFHGAASGLPRRRGRTRFENLVPPRPWRPIVVVVVIKVVGEGVAEDVSVSNLIERGLSVFDRGRECPVPLTVRGTQVLVGFAPLAPSVFCAARQNAVLRRSLLRPT